MHIIDKILQREEFKQNPPVLADIGASGDLPVLWKKIAKYSICIAFDADDREIDFLEKETETYKKLIVFNRIVSGEPVEELDFYLTKSPFCSSALPPDTEKLSTWYFSPLFQVEKKVQLKAVTLPKVLEDTKIPQIDWFKTDSQGTDLRIFKSLSDELIQKVLVAEFEPGIMDAYQGEDKLYEIMSYMHKKNFWMSHILVKGTQRISPNTLGKLSGFHRKNFHKSLITSPGWGEVNYFNPLNDSSLSKREFLLTYVFALVQKQYGFAVEVMQKAKERFDDEQFDELEKFAVGRIKGLNYRLPGIYLKKAVNKVFGAFDL